MKRLGVALLVGAALVALPGVLPEAQEEVLTITEEDMVIEEGGLEVLEEEPPLEIVEEIFEEDIIQEEAAEEIPEEEPYVPAEEILFDAETFSVKCGPFSFVMPGTWESVEQEVPQRLRFSSELTAICFELMEGRLGATRGEIEGFLDAYAGTGAGQAVRRLSMDFYGLDLQGEAETEAPSEAPTEVLTEETTFAAEETTLQETTWEQGTEVTSEAETWAEVSTSREGETEGTTEVLWEATTEAVEATTLEETTLAPVLYPEPSVYGKYSFGDWYDSRGRFEVLVLPIEEEDKLLFVSLTADSGQAQSHIGSFREMLEKAHVRKRSPETEEAGPGL